MLDVYNYFPAIEPEGMSHVSERLQEFNSVRVEVVIVQYVVIIRRSSRYPPRPPGAGRAIERGTRAS